MPNVLILCAHRPGRSPSQRYRFEQYMPFLKEHGFNFTWSFLLEEHEDAIFYSKGNYLDKFLILRKTISKRKKDVPQFKNFDIIFIQREANFLGNSDFEKKAYESGAKVIFDFDDSIWLSDTSPGNKKFEWLKKPAKFFDNLKFAHAVIAGNDYLAEKAKTINKNVIVIPSTIDTTFHIPQPDLRNKDTIIIGWSGSISTIKHFELLLPVFRKLKAKYLHKIAIKIMGQAHYQDASLDVTCITWNERTEVGTLNSFDIGIMPLPDDEWANGKCGLKGLSYMACGIATVMSNVGMNKQIINNGVNGFLINTEEEWFDKLVELIENKSLRDKLGEEGRKTVEEKYSVKANSNKYLQVFKSILN